MWLGEWLKLNEPRVKEYLTTLTPEQIGMKLPGVTLSDGTTELRGYTQCRFLNKSAYRRNDISLVLPYGYAYVFCQGEPFQEF